MSQLFSIVNILFIGITASISGTETRVQMFVFAKSKEIFLRKFLELPNGIPPKVAQDTWSALYHELGHGVLNLMHTSGGDMISIEVNKRVTWDHFFTDKQIMFEVYKDLD